jgi:NitT/TauT family transport system substrate-binding protein
MRGLGERSIGLRADRRVAILGSLLALVVLSLSACQKSADTAQYRVALGPWVGFGPLYLARDKGFFKEQGVEVDLIVLTGVAERNSALKSGKLHALAAPVDYFALSAGNGMPATIVMAIDESVGGDGIVTRQSIKSFADLRGKRVAAQKGLPSDFFLRALLQENGINIEEINYIDMETAQAGAAFLTGDLDAAVVWEPWLTRATEQGNGHILASTRDHRNLIVDCLAFNQSLIRTKPDDVHRIVNAILKAIEYANANPVEASEVVAKYFEVDPKKYRAVLEGVEFSDLKRNREYFGTRENPGPLFQVASRASEIWLNAHAIPKAVREQDIISTDFVQGKDK